MDFSDEQLVRLACGEYPADQAAAFRAAVDASPAASTRYAALAGAISRMADSAPVASLFAVPDDALRRLHESVPGPRPGITSALGAALQRAAEMVATLVFDSSRTPAAAGLRGSGRARLLEFQTDTAEIDLHVDHDDTRGITVIAGEIRGQVFPTRIVATEIRSGRLFEAEVSRDGFFDIEVPGGTYQLTIGQSDGAGIVIDHVGL